MNISELFRYKLGNSEITPGDPVRSNLMRRLERREFLRFNPSRFNVYYLGTVVAAGVVAAILITSDLRTGGNHEGATPLYNNTLKDSLSDVSQNQQVTERQLGINMADNKNVTGKSPADNRPASESKSILIKPVGENHNILTPKNSDTLQKKPQIKANIYERNNAMLLQKKAEAAFEVSSTSGCSPLKVKFMNKSLAYDSCRWVFGDGGSSIERNPDWIFDLEGEYRVTLKVYGSNGTEAAASSVIIVHPKPVARFEFNPANPIIPDDEIRFVNYSMDAVKYKWEFGDGSTSEAFEPDHRYEKYKNYNIRLIVWSEYGCSDSLMVINAFSGSGCYIDFPNAFIPNPDGPAGGYYSVKSDEAAQIFHPVTSGVSDYQLRIFSKIGILIFESNDINIGWDGYMKGQLCEPGVYIWKVRGTYRNGEPFVKMGDVTLLKK